MPKRLENEIELYPDDDEIEMLLMVSEIAWPYMTRLFYKGLLYTEREIFFALKGNGFNDVLVAAGRPRLNLVDRSRSTCLQMILHNLWRQPRPRIKKFHDGGKMFALSGRPCGVKWMLEEGKIHLEETNE